MSRNLADLTFRIVSTSGFSSSDWRLWVTRHGDVYLSARATAKMVKVSFHVSGMGRYAFTSEHGAPSGQPDRLMCRWRLPGIPESGSGKYARLAWLQFPADYLSGGLGLPLTSRITVPAGEAAQATFVEVCLAHDPPEAVALHVPSSPDRGLLLATLDPKGRTVFCHWYHGPTDASDFNVPASHGMPGYRFLRYEPVQPDRPIRFMTIPTPSDGNAFVVTEVGGCNDAT